MTIDETKLFEQVINVINSYDDILTDEDLQVLENINHILNDKWVTIKGNHILLKDGESIADAFKRHTGGIYGRP